MVAFSDPRVPAFCVLGFRVYLEGSWVVRRTRGQPLLPPKHLMAWGLGF